jgi:hypothetical protein
MAKLRVQGLCPIRMVMKTIAFLASALALNSIGLPASATPIAPRPFANPASIENVYYYHGHFYPYRYHGHYYRYHHNGHYYNHRSRHNGRWNYY